MKCLADHVSHDLSMAKFLSGLVERLNESSEFFQDWYADGGNTEFEVMWRVGDDAWPQESFNHKLFARLADMKIDLSLQVIIAEKDTTDGHVK